MMELETINELLSEEDDRLTSRFGPPKMPVTFLLSQARAGSTLFMQLALTALDIGYVNNIVARLWRAPYLGAMLERSIHDPDYVSNFRARHGNTTGAQEPHEWGWFWCHWLKIKEGEAFCPNEIEINGDPLRGKLAALEHAMKSPLLFDNVYAMNNLNVILDILPNCLALHLKRSYYFICNSLINARISRFGNINSFYGNKPRNIDAILAIKDPIEQIVAQVQATQSEITEHLNSLPHENVIQFDYLELIETPWGVMKRFAAFLNDHGAKVKMIDTVPEISLQNRNVLDLINPEHKDALDRHYRSYFGEPPAF